MDPGALTGAFVAGLAVFITVLQLADSRQRRRRNATPPIVERIS